MHIQAAHQILANHLSFGDVAIDATCGNGYDSLFLAKSCLTHTKGELHVYDIQKNALAITKKRLQKNLSPEQFERIVFHHQSHEHLDARLRPKAVCFNLGYLPYDNQAITTTATSTLIAVATACQILDDDGVVVITVYPGHPEGKKESDQLLLWCQHHKAATIHHFSQHQERPFVISIAKKTR